MTGRSCALLPGILLIAACLCLASSAEPQQGSEAKTIERAQDMIRAGQLAAADELLRSALKLDDRSGGLYNLIGIIAAEQNDHIAAKSAFLKAVEYSPTLIPALLNLARLYYTEGSRDAAIETYSRALRLNAGLEEANANLAALYLEKSRYASAERHLAALPEHLREQNRYRAMECAALAGMGESSRAKNAAQQLTGSAGEDDVSLSASVLQGLKQNTLLIALLEPIVKRGASNDLRALLANAYLAQGKLAEARSIFEALAHDNPEHAEYLTQSAHAAYRQKDYEAAAAYLLRVLQMDSRASPEEADVQFFLGIVCINLNLPGDAREHLRDAVRLRPEDPAYNYALGVATLSGGSAESAVPYFQKYSALRPGDLHGQLAMGVAEFEAGDMEAARHALNSLTSKPAAAAGAHYILGKICRRENNLDAASEHFSAALTLDRDDPELEVDLADVLLRQNKLPEAKRQLDKALARDPNNYGANQQLLVLLRKLKDPGAEQQAQRFATLTQKASNDQALLLRHIEVEQ